MALFITTLICALFGFIWDVSLHIGKGRDPGPLANPAHYFILFGLFLLFVAGCLACVLPYDKPGPSAVRITRNWYAPVGGILMAGCGLYALIGFPLDDIWHRIFGQDVTLWGPTHLMMIGGAASPPCPRSCSTTRGLKAMGDDAPTGGIVIKFMQYLGFGGIIVGLSVYQIEFDFGVPQFRQVFQPMLIAAAAAFALVAARIMLGRGAAIIAALLAIGLRGGVALIVGPILGAPINWFALYLGPAHRRRVDRPDTTSQAALRVRAVSGLGVATIGLWLESLWIGAVYHYPWPTSMWPEALAMAVPVADPHRRMRRDARAWCSPIRTLPHRAISIGLVGAHRVGHRRCDGQWSALSRARKCHGHNHSHRRARAVADQRMVTADVRIDSGRPGQRQPQLGVGPRRGRAASGEPARPWSSTRSRRSALATTASTKPVPVWGTGRRCCGSTTETC